jgi:hypothetical protein
MAFGTGTLLWCLASWYTARVLLYVNLPTTQDLYIEEDDNWSAGHLWLARNVPRILGAAPLAIIGLSMLYAFRTYEVDPPILLLVLGVCASAGSVALWWAFYKRREIMERNAKNVLQQSSNAVRQTCRPWRLIRTCSEHSKQQRRTQGFAGPADKGVEISTSSAAGCGRSFHSPVTGVHIDPIHAAGAIGTGAVNRRVVGAMGSALGTGESAREFDTDAVCAGSGFGISNDNHNIRVLNASGSSDRDSLKRRSKWHNQISKYVIACSIRFSSSPRKAVVSARLTDVDSLDPRDPQTMFSLSVEFRWQRGSCCVQRVAHG